ncbi:MAG TPA: hypothetical protein VF369_02220 [candidate division Zixibacteria bacterium]
MEIKEISYGEFPEISDLNPRFKPESKKVKATLDIQLPHDPARADLSSIIHQLMKLLPTLEKHQCGESLFDNLKSGKKEPLPDVHSSVCSCHSDKITDLAHLMEHMIIDLQSNITGMDSCSGITCGYKTPPYRFDMFVECKDQTIGLFSVLFATDVFSRLLERGNITRRYHYLIDLAKYLYRNPSKRNPASLATVTDHIAKELVLRKNYVGALMQRLKDLGFFDNRQI